MNDAYGAQDEDGYDYGHVEDNQEDGNRCAHRQARGIAWARVALGVAGVALLAVFSAIISMSGTVQQLSNCPAPCRRRRGWCACNRGLCEDVGSAGPGQGRARARLHLDRHEQSDGFPLFVSRHQTCLRELLGHLVPCARKCRYGNFLQQHKDEIQIVGV